MQTSSDLMVYDIWDYEKQLVIRYQRTGDCDSCGLCCRRRIEFSVAQPAASENPRQGGYATTGRGIWAEIRQNGTRMFYRLRENLPDSHRCCHLEEGNRCKIYSSRSMLCRAWPFSPMDIENIPECTYQFSKLAEWSFEEVGK